MISRGSANVVVLHLRRRIMTWVGGGEVDHRSLSALSRLCGSVMETMLATGLIFILVLLGFGRQCVGDRWLLARSNSGIGSKNPVWSYQRHLCKMCIRHRRWLIRHSLALLSEYKHNPKICPSRPTHLEHHRRQFVVNNTRAQSCLLTM